MNVNWFFISVIVLPILAIVGFILYVLYRFIKLKVEIEEKIESGEYE